MRKEWILSFPRICDPRAGPATPFVMLPAVRAKSRAATHGMKHALATACEPPPHDHFGSQAASLPACAIIARGAARPCGSRPRRSGRGLLASLARCAMGGRSCTARHADSRALCATSGTGKRPTDATDGARRFAHRGIGDGTVAAQRLERRLTTSRRRRAVRMPRGLRRPPSDDAVPGLEVDRWQRRDPCGIFRLRGAISIASSPRACRRCDRMQLGIDERAGGLSWGRWQLVPKARGIVTHDNGPSTAGTRPLPPRVRRPGARSILRSRGGLSPDHAGRRCFSRAHGSRESNGRAALARATERGRWLRRVGARRSATRGYVEPEGPMNQVSSTSTSRIVEVEADDEGETRRPWGGGR